MCPSTRMRSVWRICLTRDVVDEKPWADHSKLLKQLQYQAANLRKTNQWPYLLALMLHPRLQDLIRLSLPLLRLRCELKLHNTQHRSLPLHTLISRPCLCPSPSVSVGRHKFHPVPNANVWNESDGTGWRRYSKGYDTTHASSSIRHRRWLLWRVS